MENCPFCSTPLSKKKNFCFKCNSFSIDALFMDEESRKISKFPYAKKEIINSKIPEFKKIINQSPQDTQNLFNLALAYLNVQNYEDSIKLWERVIDLSPGNSIAMNNLGVCHLSLGKTNFARLVLQKAYKIDSTSPTINYNMGSLCRMEYDMDKAIKFYKEYNIQRPDNPYVSELILKYSSNTEEKDNYNSSKTVAPFQIQEISEDKKEKTTGNSSSIELIFDKYNNEKLDEAFDLICKLDLEANYNQEEKSKLAKILSQKGSRNHKEQLHLEAAECYEKAMKLNPNLPLSGKISQQYFKAGENFYDKYLIKEAIENLEKSIKWDKSSPARTSLIKILTKEAEKIITEDKQTIEEMDLFKKILEIDPENEFASKHITKSGEKVTLIPEEKSLSHKTKPLEKEKKSLPHKTKSTEITYSKKYLAFLWIILIIISLGTTVFIMLRFFGRNNLSFDSKGEELYFKGLDAERKGELDKAIQLIEESLGVIPDYSEARNHLGQLYDRKGREEDALIQFQKAVNINPNYAAAYDNLALICTKLDNNLKAKEYRLLAKEYYSIKSSEVKKAMKFYNNNQMTAAIKSLNKAINIDPEDPALHYNLALAMLKSARVEESRSELEKAIKIARSRGIEEYVEKFSEVLTNLESEDLVVDFIVYNQPVLEPTIPEVVPTETIENIPSVSPAPEVTHSPDNTTLPDEDPQVVAVDTMYIFFQNIDSKNYDQAYSLLIEEKQKETSPEEFTSKFQSLSSIKVSSVRILETTDTSIKLKVYLTAQRNKEEGAYLGAFQGIYVLLWQNAGWKISEGQMEETTLKGEDDTKTF